MDTWELGFHRVKRTIGDMVLDMMANAKKMPQSDDYNMEEYAKNYFTGGAMYPKDGPNANDGKIHYPDTYKYPSHLSFSDDSMYRIGLANVPHWFGGKLPDGESESWGLYRPNGELVRSEAPWNTEGVRDSGPYK